MNINKIAYHPNFQAKFIYNEDIMDLTKKEIKTGRQDALCKALGSLDETHKNVRLLLHKENGNYIVRNLYNNNSVVWADKADNSREIMKLSNPFSDSYYRLFSNGIKPTDDRKAGKLAVNVADKYYTDYVPDYHIGKLVDASF